MSVKSKSYLYQHGTLGGLMEDLMDGTEQIGKMLTYGNTGIGTLAGSNGEIIFLDGVIYHVDETGQVNQLEGTETTPYAAVVDFEATDKLTFGTETTDENLKMQILRTISPNLFSAIKIHGMFDRMHVRVAPKQEKPYPKFVEITQNQPEFTATEIAGTVVGFFTPKLFHGAAAAGFHLHFISDNHQFAGHILDFGLISGEAELMEVAEFRQHFPVDNQDFLEREIDVEKIARDIEEAE
jgi:acetolactate decarboxylase